MRYLVATDGRRTNEALLPYLEPRLGAADTVHVVHSLKGEEKDAGLLEDESDVVIESREALSSIENQLSSQTDVETHQIVRGNDPHADILAFADEHDVDEIVLGIRQRSAGERALFGSTAQNVLMNTDRPVVAIPLSENS